MLARPHAPAASRNAAPILEALTHELDDCSKVLEVGSGTGQHAVFFASRLAHLQWQPSDLKQNLPGIREWLDHAEPDNVADPLELDVLVSAIPAERYDAVFSANTAHIMSYDAVRKMIELVGEVTEPGGKFCLYGPFKLRGAHTTESNAAFDESLRSRNPRMGIRNLDDLEDLAAASGLSLRRVYAMPTNNFLIVWSKSSSAELL